MLLLNNGRDGVGVPALVIIEVPDNINTPVITALAPEDEVLLLKTAARADVEVLVPPAVLVNTNFCYC